MAISLLAFNYISFFTPREEFYLLISIYALLFGAYIYLVKTCYEWGEIRLLLISALLFRVSLIWLIPNLSDDFYRFIWDGRLLVAGENPFQYLPSEIFGSSGLDQILFNSLNSPNYFSVYPPVHQLVFGVASYLCPNSIEGVITVMRLFVIAADIGIVWLGIKILDYLGMPISNILWYALNPLVILELTGNLHFEGIMLFFVMLAFYLLIRNKLAVAAFAFGLSVSTKLLPLMFIPVLLNYLGVKKGGIFVAIVGGVVAISFAPFISMEMILNMSSSIDLYFQKFEFNASLYYLVSGVYKWIVGYNMISIVGPCLSFVSMIMIVWLSFRKRITEMLSLYWVMLLCSTCHLLFSTTVHPWYLVMLVLISCFTRFIFPIVWSVVIFVSYFAYSTVDYSESVPLLVFEYLTVVLAMAYDFKFRYVQEA
ncbi:MAG: DUF2029 domain-containing protein [Flavobacteriales bacterium]|nr:DUF2029 domain-containing protein [Flavobacteriales bacterium]